MSNAMDYDTLMMDALDNRLNESGRAALSEYFRHHPDERVIFERMLGIDHAMHNDPISRTPVQLKSMVMTAVTQMPATLQTLKTAQIVFLAGIACLSFAVIGAVLIAIYLSISPAFPQVELSGVIVVMRTVLDIAVSLLGAMISLLRAIFSQPLTWLVTLGLFTIVALWLRVMVALYLPHMVLNAS